MSNIVAIVGRPNVGKSTFYNRMIGERQAITDNVSGVTRDRMYGEMEWNGKQFTVVDTGGFVEGSDDVFEKEIRAQVRIAVAEAEAIIFMTDARTGATDLDLEVANLLRRSEKPVYLCVNKVDNHEQLMEANEFWSMGFDNTFFVSSMTGSGTGDLLDAVAEKIENKPPLDTDLPRIAIVGQPNVGKSSFTNALLGEDRNIVTDIAGTTRDSIHTKYKKFGKEFFLIDTAGIRKKSKVHEDLEFYSVMRAIRALEEADVVILMIDATLGVEMQDLKIFRLAQQRNKGIVILVNKWDLVEKETNTARDMEKEIRERFAPFRDLPVIFVSALEKQRIFQAVEEALDVNERRNTKITTSQLNDYFQPILDKNPPPATRGRLVKIKYITQLPTYYPAFAFFCSNPKYIREDYKNFLENKLREKWNFTGVPVSVFFRKK